MSHAYFLFIIDYSGHDGYKSNIMRNLILCALTALTVCACTYHPPKPPTEAEKAQQLKNNAFNQNREDGENAVNDCFSGYDGSCTCLVKYIKDHMNDPESFEHISTKYAIRQGYYYVVMEYTGKNGFGGRVRDYVAANVTFKGEVLKAWK
jgi:hypothetical protein